MAGTRDTDDVSHLMAGDGPRSDASEGEIVLLSAGRRRVRRNEPEQRLRTGERPVENSGLAVRPLDHLDAVAYVFIESRGIPHDHSNITTSIE